MHPMLLEEQWRNQEVIWWNHYDLGTRRKSLDTVCTRWLFCVYCTSVAPKLFQSMILCFLNSSFLIVSFFWSKHNNDSKKIIWFIIIFTPDNILRDRKNFPIWHTLGTTYVRDMIWRPRDCQTTHDRTWRWRERGRPQGVSKHWCTKELITPGCSRDLSAADFSKSQ